MRKLLFLFSCILVINLSGYAQDINYDSIYQRLEKSSVTKQDLTRLDSMLYLDPNIPDSVRKDLIFLGVERTRELNLDYLYAKFIFNKSILRTLSGDFSNAIELANESLEIFIANDAYVDISGCYNTIGGMIAAGGDFETGKKYLLKAIDFNERKKDHFYHHRAKGDNLLVLGNILLKEGNLDSAQLLFEQALEYTQIEHFVREQIFSLINLGRVFKEKELFPLAKRHFCLALKEAKSTHMQTVKAVANRHLADIAITERDYDSAVFFLDAGLKACWDNGDFLPIQLDILNRKANLFADMGAHHQAFQIQKEALVLRDSFFSIEKEKEVRWVETEFQAKQKDQEIQLLSQQSAIQALEIRQKNQAIIIGAAAVLFALLIGYFFYKQRQSKLLGEQTELEQRFLRSQLNPHFISNAMVAVQNFMLRNNAEKASGYLAKFSKLMREILENSRQEFIPVEDEISMLTNYLEIHKLRCSGSFDYNIIIDEEIDAEEDSITPMFVQPFVENAIEHGISNLDRKGEINIYFKKEEGYISVDIIDNGRGLNSSPNKKDHRSLSTQIIQERIQLFNRSLKNKIRLAISEVQGANGEIAGTKVELKVPFV